MMKNFKKMIQLPLRCWKRVKKIYSWIRLLLKDYDWDYGYMIKMEKFKLEKMLNYFSSEKCFLNEADQVFVVNKIKLAISLLDIADGTEEWWHIEYSNKKINQLNEFILDKKVNTNNWKRFYKTKTISKKFLESNSFKIDLRESKAWFLYNKLRAYWMCGWWD